MITELSQGRVEFRFFRRGAKDVCVVGSFNGWRAGAAPMQAIGDGWWRAALELPEGIHQFRYIADGEWFTDHAAHGIEKSRFAWNSVLIVGPARSIAA